MQTIIKEIAFNPTIKEFMLNADVTQVFNQTWIQILCSGILGSIIGGAISGGITWFAMKTTDNTANKRWEKNTFKNFECDFWLKFYKKFHIINRFITPFLRDIIYSKEQYFVPSLMLLTEDREKIIFRIGLNTLTTYII